MANFLDTILVPLFGRRVVKLSTLQKHTQELLFLSQALTNRERQLNILQKEIRGKNSIIDERLELLGRQLETTLANQNILHETLESLSRQVSDVAATPRLLHETLELLSRRVNDVVATQSILREKLELLGRRVNDGATSQNTLLERYRFLNFRDLLSPRSVRNFSKARIGAPHDGGYIMIDDFSDVDGAVSLGVG